MRSRRGTGEVRTLLQLLWVKNYESTTMEEFQNRKDGKNGKTANSEERGRKRENGKNVSVI